MRTGDHTQRVKQMLIDAGVSKYGLTKRTSRYLPQVIHENETIGGVVYGRYKNGLAMLVATDQRVIFLDKKPLFVTMDELTYDVVSGVKFNKSGIVDSVTLHTKVADYLVRFVNDKCAYRFVDYIEKRRLERDYSKLPSEKDSSISDINFNQPFSFISPDAVKFMHSREVAVLSSIDRTGNINGSPVYYLVDQQNQIYIITKEGTTKVRNILSNNQVALTIFDEKKAKTLNIQATAEFISDQKIIGQVFNEIVRPRNYENRVKLPPVAYLNAGDFKVLRITPISGKYSDYSK